MYAPTTRAFTPARIVALALIAVLVGGLAYLHFAPSPGLVAVPEGAKAGDVSLEPCTYATEKGSYAADCGTLVVPENRAEPQSRLIALPVTRIRARSGQPGEPVFRLEGGPGLTNMKFSKASRLAAGHDVVLVGYRGVDGSVRLDCPEVVSALKRSSGFLAVKSMRAYADALRSCAKRLTADGVDLAGYTLPERADDLDAARVALGYQRVDLLSESAGTRTAMIYAWRHPRSVHRSVMIGVNPPGHFLYDPKTTDDQIRRYSGLCSRDTACRARTADSLAASMAHTAAHMPDRWLFLPIDEGNVRLASFFGLMETTSAANPLSAPITLRAWQSAANGDPSGFWFQSLVSRLAFPESFVWGDIGAASRADVGAAERYFSSGEHRSDSILGNPATEFIWAGGRMLDAWPANASDNQYSRVRTSKVETLLIGGTLDVATPAVNATRELLPHLPNGNQVVLAELGHSTSFWNEQPKASTRLLNAFLDTGQVDDSLYTHQAVDFTPAVTHTALGKGFAGTMLGLALLVPVSLLLMWRRVRRRGGFGRKASVALRSVYLLVLGLGGWFTGVLIVLVAMPTVPIDDELLAALSIGAPIGLGTYLAWVDRDWSAKDKTVGLAGATAGALVGAWLGFHATTGLLAVITTIIGAAVGANLTLILLDIVGDRPVTELAEPSQRALTTAEA
jgi:pimeloyl-ACP methyl ester carboxylesterase